jgi:linoleate 10R-lipoxygenase
LESIGNLAHVHFAANVFSLPLKSKEHPKGVFTEHEMYMAMAVIFTCIFFDLDPAKSWPLHMASRKLAKVLGKLVEANVKAVNMTGFIAGIVDSFSQNQSYLGDYGVHMVRRLLDSGIGPEEVAWSQILPTAIAMVPNQAQVFTQILDYYLSPVGQKHLPEINRLAKLDTADADAKLLRYAMEGIRLNGTFGSYREASGSISINDGYDAYGRERHVNIKPGDKVFVSFVGAAKDKDMFPDGDEVRLDRPMENYIHYGIGPHECLGKDASRVALTAMLKVVGRLDNLRRAPGPKGELKKIPR